MNQVLRIFLGYILIALALLGIFIGSLLVLFLGYAMRDARG